MAKDYPPIALRTDINPWEQQEPKETSLMYARFQVYMELPPEVDRLRQTLEILNATSEQKITLAALKTYSTGFRWAQRAGAHDRYVRQADVGRMIKRRRKVRDEQMRAASALRGSALEALRQIPVEDLSPQDIVRFIELAWKLEKSIFEEFADMPMQTTTADGGTVIDVASWTPAERQRRLVMLQGELNRRAAREMDDDEVVA